jgi:SH3 domain-containing YSC84-like protein 1
MNVLNSRVFPGISGADDSTYNDILQYDDRHHDVVWEGRRGCGEGQPRNTGDDLYGPKRASTWADNVYEPAFTSKTGGLKDNQAVALFTFEADQPGFKKGDIITVTKTGKAIVDPLRRLWHRRGSICPQFV